SFFFLPRTSTSAIYTLSLHDALPIFHNGGSENISEAQVLDAVRILNRDFRKQNADVNNVVSQFQSIAGDVEIEFALAKVAPNGRSEEHTSELQSRENLVCRLLLEKKK